MSKEVSLLLQLQHERVVRLHDVWETDKTMILVMELMECSLFDLVFDRGRLASDEARHVFVQVVEGLKFIHSKHIVHRDLKPENILVCSEPSSQGYPEVKISDFGHSKLIHDGYTRACSFVGTDRYWAPEVAATRGVRRSGESYDERADLW